MNSLISERLPVIATVDSQTVTTSEVFSDVVDMSKYLRVRAIFMGGNMAADGSMICRAVTCDSAGNNAAAFKTADTVEAGTDNSQVIIEVANEDLAGGAANADRYVKFGIKSAGSGGPVSVVVEGEPFFKPTDDLATVVEIEIDKD
jgi:hypothetical protein